MMSMRTRQMYGGKYEHRPSQSTEKHQRRHRRPWRDLCRSYAQPCQGKVQSVPSRGREKAIRKGTAYPTRGGWTSLAKRRLSWGVIPLYRHLRGKCQAGKEWGSPGMMLAPEQKGTLATNEFQSGERRGFLTPDQSGTASPEEEETSGVLGWSWAGRGERSWDAIA